MKNGKVILIAAGSFVFGMAITVIVIFGWYHNARIKRLEIQQNQIIQVLAKAKRATQVQPAPKPQPQPKIEKEPVE
jgi:hypothetical protein